MAADTAAVLAAQALAGHVGAMIGRRPVPTSQPAPTVRLVTTGQQAATGRSAATGPPAETTAPGVVTGGQPDPLDLAHAPAEAPAVPRVTGASGEMARLVQDIRGGGTGVESRRIRDRVGISDYVHRRSPLTKDHFPCVNLRTRSA